MKFTAMFGSLLAFSSLGHAAINLSYTPEDDQEGKVVLGENVRIAWESDKTYDLHLEMVRKQDNKKHWPSGWQPIETMLMNLRLNEGRGEYLYNIPVGKGSRTSVTIKDGELCAFVLTGTEIDGSGLGYVNHTSWFPVVKNEIAPKDGFKEQAFSG